jgi:hypothetical protein
LLILDTCGILTAPPSVRLRLALLSKKHICQFLGLSRAAGRIASQPTLFLDISPLHRPTAKILRLPFEVPATLVSLPSSNFFCRHAHAHTTQTIRHAHHHRARFLCAICLVEKSSRLSCSFNTSLPHFWCSLPLGISFVWPTFTDCR